jgi:hypothetical protein
VNELFASLHLRQHSDTVTKPLASQYQILLSLIDHDCSRTRRQKKSQKQKEKRKRHDTTTAMGDLSSAFGNLGFVTNTSPPQQYHTLNITYPALDLLPDKDTPAYLYPPNDLHFRQRPRLEGYHLTPTNLAFFHRIPVNRYLGLAFASQYNDWIFAQEFLDLITSLVKSPGHSTLEIVTFNSGKSTDGICHTFRATVTWAQADRAASPTVHTCQLSKPQFESLLKAHCPSGACSGTGRYPWLSLVKNLIYRESDRACLQVAQQLQASTTPAYRGEGARWARDWDTSALNSGSFLLASRLQCQLGNGEWIPVHDLDRENLVAHSNEQMQFLLPCGHEASFALKALSMTQDSRSAEVACVECGEKVLGDKEMAQLALRLEYQERATFCYLDAEYSDAKIPWSAPGRGQDLEIPPGALHRALQDALESLRVPESASPRSLSLVEVAETKAVLRALQLKAAAAGRISVRLTPYALWDALMQSSMMTLTGLFESGSGNLPPDFIEFMGKWLTRAVNLLIVDQGLLPSLERAADELSSLMNTCAMR